VTAPRRGSSGALDYDAELRRHDAVLREACAIGASDHVVDIGCGTGHTTRQAARLARDGSVLGIDVSATAIDEARRLARADALGNVSFVCADAQVHPLPSGHFDLAMSRFGTMFFGDATAGFANIVRALRPDGRLVMLVWQAPHRNEWDVAIRRALEADADRTAPDPFSLADPATVTEVLGAAGFAHIALTDVAEPVFYGPDVDTALAWVGGFTATSRALGGLGPAAADAATERLRDALAAHLGADGVWFGSRAWLVTARRP